MFEAHRFVEPAFKPIRFAFKFYESLNLNLIG